VCNHSDKLYVRRCSFLLDGVAMGRRVFALLLLLASAAGDVGRTAGGRAAATGAAAGLLTTARQVACPALSVSAKCAALKAVLSEREDEDVLAGVPVHWVVALVVIRAAVVFADDQAV